MENLLFISRAQADIIRTILTPRRATITRPGSVRTAPSADVEMGA